MSDHIDTRDGWREINIGGSEEAHLHAIYQLAEYDRETGELVRAWVRVPSLPTDPGYYVDADGSAWRLGEDGEWDDTFGNPTSPGAVDPAPPLVRYEPRAVTAKIALNAIRAYLPAEQQPWVEHVKREFGVES